MYMSAYKNMKELKTAFKKTRSRGYIIMIRILISHAETSPHVVNLHPNQIPLNMPVKDLDLDFP